MEKWYAAIVKFSSLEKAVEAAHYFDAQGYENVEVDSSEWKEVECQVCGEVYEPEKPQHAHISQG